MDRQREPEHLAPSRGGGARRRVGRGARKPLLVGPSVHIQPDWIIDFVLALPAPLPLDVFAYHMYEGYGKAPRIASQVPTVALIN